MSLNYLLLQISTLNLCQNLRVLKQNLKYRKYNAMRNEFYDLDIASDKMTFEFTSVGPKGKIPKLVLYTKTGIKDLYNLGFGDKDINTGDIDDTVITDNKDSLKVLATVASTVYVFLSKYPNVAVVAKGSTKSRTRLYQIGISNNLEEICADFNVYGRIERFWYPFKKNVEYDAFFNH